jgi:hypothetical protein
VQIRQLRQLLGGNDVLRIANPQICSHNSTRLLGIEWRTADRVRAYLRWRDPSAGVLQTAIGRLLGCRLRQWHPAREQGSGARQKAWSTAADASRDTWHACDPRRASWPPSRGSSSAPRV